MPKNRGLDFLEGAIARDLELIKYPGTPWVKQRSPINDTRVYDVIIIGAGHAGISAASSLMMEKIDNILVVDENRAGFEGPWRTFARMPKLRTPKYVVGPDSGIPNLTVRAWYEAQYGEKAWKILDFIPTEIWAEYLSWFRIILKLPIKNETKIGKIEWNADNNCFTLTSKQVNNDNQIFYARKIVLANGIDGSGTWNSPRIVTDTLSSRDYAHTKDPIDFSQLSGKSVAILGAGASAFDAALAALHSNCTSAHIFFRRETLPTVNPYRWTEFVGFLNHHANLSDEMRWKFISQIFKMGQLPPRDTYLRAIKFNNFFLHSGCEILSVVKDQNIILKTSKGDFRHDCLVTATGFKTDLSRRQELTSIHQHIALWKDRYIPPALDTSEELSNHPYLGPNFEFQEKDPGKSPWITSIFNFNFGSILSVGLGGGSISGVKYGLKKLVYGISCQLYKDDIEQFFGDLIQYNVRENP